MLWGIVSRILKFIFMTSIFFFIFLQFYVQSEIMEMQDQMLAMQRDMHIDPIEPD